LEDGRNAVLALVVEAEGSTYVGAGAIALFAGEVRVGWLSGGCLESEIAARAESAADSGCIEWMEIDTRDDESLFGGSALGCRGRLRLALLPLRTLIGWIDLAASWLSCSGPMEISLSSTGELQCSVERKSARWEVATSPPNWGSEIAPGMRWSVSIAAPPSVLVFGTGPEAPILLPLLRAMGWMSTAAESRPRWQENAYLADTLISDKPARLAQSNLIGVHFAALVMHHNFELDLETLLVLAPTSIPFIGLLGPNRRREDLFRLLPESAVAALLPRLHSPVGMDLGGRGPEAIALSIAAQLQARLHAR
ncbi:XdhC family protein, partial [Dokdonella sp.]|uniref:XdhC family protein n=1 Tax=Dokdonella sp. TaxID=2291710 RepID=UPI003C413F9E